jgi:tetratricopeptide (TPR) repeat protein
VASYDRSAELDPKLVDPLYHEGVLFEQLGRTEEAERRLNQVLRLDPSRNEARLELGNALFRAGRPDEALAQYQAAMGRSSISAQAYNNIGTIWFDRRNFPEAIRFYREALKAGADSADTRLNLGNALALSGDLAGAAEQFQAALRLDPTDDQARDHLAKVQAALAGR